VGELVVLQHQSENDGSVSLLSAAGERLLLVNSYAHRAFAFIAQTGAFYVRELLQLDAAEKMSLVATLVEHRILRVGA
jgi:hypothetical protein